MMRARSEEWWAMKPRARSLFLWDMGAGMFGHTRRQYLAGVMLAGLRDLRRRRLAESARIMAQRKGA